MLYTWTRRLPNLISRSWKRSRRPIRRKPVARHKPAFEQLEDLTLLSTINWTGAANDNNWNSTGNWDLGRLPTASDDALIGPAFSGMTITHSSSASDAVNSLNSRAAFSLTGGTLTISVSSTINGDLTLSAALAGAGDLTVNGLTTWTSGTMSGTGHTIADGGVSLSGALPKTLIARSLDNFGTAVWSGSGIVGSIILSNGAVWNNEPGSVFDYQLDVSASINNGGGITPPQFNNAGLLLKSASTGTMAVGVALNNTGTVQVSTGTVNLSGGGTSSGTFSVGSILIFSGGTFTMQSGAAFTGAGSVQVPTFGALNVAGNVSLPNLVLNGGTLTGTGNVSVTNALN